MLFDVVSALVVKNLTDHDTAFLALQTVKYPENVMYTSQSEGGGFRPSSTRYASVAGSVVVPIVNFRGSPSHLSLRKRQ